MRRAIPVLALLIAGAASAAEPVATQIGRTQRGGVAVAQNAQTASDIEQARVWGLTVEEVQRARQLMQPGSPRATFSSPNISPVEVLGIHAQTAAERTRYATLFAKALRADTERVLAWTATYGQVTKRLYPNEMLLNFGGAKLPKSQEVFLR